MASFFVIRGKDKGQHFAVRGANATIGREATNQIQLRDTEVSRRHARIIRKDNSTFEIVDAKSSNGTFVNSRRVESKVLKSGDRVQVGRTLLIFTGGPEPLSSQAIERVEIVASDAPHEISRIRSSLESHSAMLGEVFPTGDSSASAQERDSSDAEVSRPQGDAERWEFVYKVSQAINRTGDIHDLLAQVLGLIFDWIECDRGCVLMTEDVGSNLRPICSLDRKTLNDRGENSDARRMRISRTILDHVVTSEEGVLTSNAQDDQRWQDAESVASLGVHEAICVPMLGRYGLVGAIYVDTSVSAGVFAERAGDSLFDDQHLKLMMAIANQAALAIEDTQFYHAMVQSERLAVMGQTIANLSHHVKNILQGVSGGSFLVEDGLEKSNFDVVRKGWSIVQRNQARISNLVMDMLTFSKDRELDLISEDLVPTISDVTEVVENRAAKQGVTIRWSPPVSPFIVSFDPESLHRALLNVLSNAVDAAAEVAEGLVEIQIGQKSELIQISVSDNGPGIADADRQRIFSPFESTKGAKGTGLGLPVSQKILREHGGDITFRSELGQGTTFLLYWPNTPQSPSHTLPG